jgi:DnaK suppressor protein
VPSSPASFAHSSREVAKGWQLLRETDTMSAARRMQFPGVMQTTTVRAIRNRLHVRRHQVLAHYKRMLALAEEEQQPEPELIDTANEQWDVRLLSQMSDADARALTQIVEALHRLQTGRYGVCVMCEQPICAERLALLPETAHCVSCATIAERPRA